MQAFLITNLPLYYFTDPKTGNINQNLFWEPKRLQSTEYHFINDNEIFIDKMGQDFKDFIYSTKFNNYKKIYFPITAILTLTINANREYCFISKKLTIDGKQRFVRVEFRKENNEE